MQEQIWLLFSTGWQPIPFLHVSAFPSKMSIIIRAQTPMGGLAYLWADTPVRRILGAPIYGQQGFPAAPYLFDLQSVEMLGWRDSVKVYVTTYCT